jgi:hypothetical protein
MESGFFMMMLWLVLLFTLQKEACGNYSAVIFNE